MSCLNRKTLLILAGIGLAVWAVAPGAIGAVAPLLIAAACPIGMFVMMRGAVGSADGRSCRTETPNGPAATPVADASADEVARLRWEVADLRAQVAGQSRPGDAEPGERTAPDCPS
jgi:hypothetical protein